jgi:hypothetical protein
MEDRVGGPIADHRATLETERPQMREQEKYLRQPGPSMQ